MLTYNGKTYEYQDLMAIGQELASMWGEVAMMCQWMMVKSYSVAQNMVNYLLPRFLLMSWKIMLDK